MTVDELKQACAQAKADAIKYSFTPGVDLVLPWAARGRTVRLAGRSGPRGEVLCVNCDNKTVARFDPDKVLAWFEAHGGLT